MAGLWKRDGTVAVTSGSKKVTGTGTTFADAKNGVAKGHLFCMTTGATVDLYEVDYVVSNTELFLVQAFRGVTGTGKAYEVITTFSDSIPEFARKLNASLSYYQGQSDMVQQLFTSDAAEITVTAPDGTTHKLVPWKRVTSDGEGQAARAKVEADRSKTEADRSGAEADRAAGIVAAAALPLPDVWAPLSDSLRLITGYGRDVLVGSDVVARMVNFSRSTTATYIGKDGQLKTAAANEPRFEKEGLLIEGQSVNIVTNSNVFTPYGTGATKVDNQPGPFGANDATRIDTVNAYTGTNQTLPSSLVDGAVYTTSVWLRGAVGGEAVRIGIHNSTVGLGVTLTTEWKRYSITQTRFAGTNSAFVIQAVNATTSFFVYGAQLEALPFASSYIPTAGAAVTRAADKAWLNVAGNLIPLSVIALEFNSIAPSSFYQAPNLTRYIVQAGDGTGITAYLGRFTTQFEDSGAAQGAIIQQGRIVVVGGVSGGKATIRSGAALSSGLAIKGFKPTELYLCNASVGSADRQAFGHVRNLRIYHRDLTADQYKAVAA
ncbi:hypothetical protein G9455_11770 [Aeromonas hydrophila]|uniref:phage head spike fiber domain-containing protein n=1 Tax=Aeromonas hydrophila TaxID=644 RepID=UPI0005B7BDEF|nr:hypothetical protein [Aeromonas hydrophila]AKJ37069.1 hypothetical protein U876_11545 [Aeromonas hydrophila NJ-35]ALZ80136.1 hypothetical protein AhyD4_11250 [Aeromonas hydrophila]MCA4698027.1 hypothetical protein [Aeromonas hydrophila]ODM36402.1 hypothetical protein A7J16_01900 [Aeromonas hydrophila]OSO88590.1 hypothetical protein B7E00_15750 [Aeromonas hydrophila]